jgi:hypothetical protein
MPVSDWAPFLTAGLHTGATELSAKALATMAQQVLTHVLRYTEGNQLLAVQILGMTRYSLPTGCEHSALSLNAPCAQQMTSLLPSRAARRHALTSNPAGLAPLSSSNAFRHNVLHAAR